MCPDHVRATKDFDADEGLDLDESPASPRSEVLRIADSLEQAAASDRRVWVVRRSALKEVDIREKIYDDDPNLRGNASAWPSWFRRVREKAADQLLYLLGCESVAGIAAAVAESGGHGIFCNDSEAAASRWPKGVHPAVPVWLSNCFEGTPYDPATGPEASAILRTALDFGEGEGGLFYLSAHDRAARGRSLSVADTEAAFRGMYLVRSSIANAGPPRIRLLGGGSTLANVLRAADLLREDWHIDCEVWSCPSYTRLARDADAAEQWNLLHPLSPRLLSHLQTCLHGDSPVVAVTGYPRQVAEQIRGFLTARFATLGSDVHPGAPSTPRAHWIVATALGALRNEDGGASRLSQQALIRYGLA